MAMISGALIILAGAIVYFSKDVVGWTVGAIGVVVLLWGIIRDALVTFRYSPQRPRDP